MNSHVRLASVAGASPLTRSALSKPMADPIFAAIEEARATLQAWVEVCAQVDRAEERGRKKHGCRPYGLVSWRGYSAIGGAEIERARREFLLLPAIDPKKIEKEYRDAKARERAAKRDQRQWDKRIGVADLRRKLEELDEADYRAHMRMATTRPTPGGAAALLAYLAEEMEILTEEWHAAAVKTVIAALRFMAKEKGAAKAA